MCYLPRRTRILPLNLPIRIMITVDTPTVLLTEFEAGQYLQRSPRMVAAMRKLGLIPAERAGLRLFLYRKDALDNYLSAAKGKEELDA
jgi:hypothetical protein